MRSRVFLVLAISLIQLSVAAQSDSSARKPRYFLSCHAGGLFGKDGNGASLTSSLIQGVKYERFSIGAGVGHDVYIDWRIIPFFGSFSYDLAGRRKNSLFLGLNAGYSKAWNPAFDQLRYAYSRYRGSFFHPLIGYRIANGNLRAYMALGYKFQRLSYEYIIDYFDQWRSDTKVTVKRQMQRLSIEIGIGFR